MTKSINYLVYQTTVISVGLITETQYTNLVHTVVAS